MEKTSNYRKKHENHVILCENTVILQYFSGAQGLQDFCTVYSTIKKLKVKFSIFLNSLQINVKHVILLLKQ